jgi:hypothetical protein
MEGREKPHTDKYKEIVNRIMMPAAYITSGFGLTKFKALDFCCIDCVRKQKGSKVKCQGKKLT